MTTTILELPDECLSGVLSFLKPDPKPLSNIAQVDKRLQKLSVLLVTSLEFWVGISLVQC